MTTVTLQSRRSLPGWLPDSVSQSPPTLSPRSSCSTKSWRSATNTSGASARRASTATGGRTIRSSSCPTISRSFASNVTPQSACTRAGSCFRGAPRKRWTFTCGPCANPSGSPNLASRTNGAAPETLPQRLRTWSRTRSQAVFCTFLAAGKSEPITFGQLFERSCAYARFYGESGVKRGDLVIVILQHSPHLFYGYLGALIAGAIPSFMPFPSAKQRADLYWTEHH